MKSIFRDAQGKAEFPRLGGRGVPLIVVGDKTINGYDEAGLAGMLRDAGHRR